MYRFCGWVVVVGALCLPLRVHAATCSSETAAPEAVVMVQHRAYVAHDLEAFAACYADDVVITDLSGRRKPIAGMPALREV